MVKPIVMYGDPRLTQSSEIAETSDADIGSLVRDLVDTSESAKGAGLAAVQIGVMKRVAVIKGPKNRGYLALINPEVVWASSERAVSVEGCLSIPKFRFQIIRPRKVKVRFQDMNRTPKTIEFSGDQAICVQHEIDHLNGILFIQRTSPNDKTLINRLLGEKGFAPFFVD